MSRHPPPYRQLPPRIDRAWRISDRLEVKSRGLSLPKRNVARSLYTALNDVQFGISTLGVDSGLVTVDGNAFRQDTFQELVS